MASGAWTDEAGQSVDWQDGALAVIPDKTVSVSSDICAYGLEYTAATAECYLTGSGKLTLGAGGLAVTAGNKQINIRNNGGVHLAADQIWTRSDAVIVCLDEMKPLTAEPGITWTIGGRTIFRVNSNGQLGADVTVVLRESAQLSPAEGGKAGLGSPKLVFEGSGVTTGFGSRWCSSVLDGKYASNLCLRSGGSLAFNASKLCNFKVPELTVDGDAANSHFKGGLVWLAPGQTVFNVAADHVLTLGAILTNAPGATANIVKRGAGTLTLTQPEEPIDFTVSEGTLKFAFPGYRHYRFKIDGVRGSKATGVQIAELKLLNGGEEIPGGKVTYAEGTKVTWDAGKDCSPGEDPTMATDGSLDTKWLDWRASVSRIVDEGDNVWVQLNYDAPVVATGYSWATANDAAPSGDVCNDPSAWRLLASDDGENWVELDQRTDMGPYEARKTWVGVFSVAYPTGRGAAAKLGHVIIESNGTLDMRGFTAPAIINGIIENRGGQLLTDAGTLTGNSVSVLGGTFSRGLSTFGGKFFRVTVTGNGGVKQTSIAEFSLYATDGSRVNKGKFTRQSVESVAALEANQVLLTTSGGSVSSWENIDRVFDGNPDTKCYVSDLTPSVETPIVFAFRLPDSAARVAGYTFTTAADTVINNGFLRNPNGWMIEGSFDGETWHVLDEKTEVSTPRTNGTEFNEGVPYAVAGWGDPAEGEEYPFDQDAVVSVASGAVLELLSEKMVIGHLAVDGEAGSGTITRFTPGPNGTLDLTVSDSKSVREGFVLPLTIGEVANAKNFASWTVKVNGVKKKACRLAFADGRLVVHSTAFLLMIR